MEQNGCHISHFVIPYQDILGLFHGTGDYQADNVQGLPTYQGLRAQGPRGPGAQGPRVRSQHVAASQDSYFNLK